MAEAGRRDQRDGGRPFEIRSWKALPGPPARRIGRYEILARGRLGRGYEARDPSGRLVELRPLPWTDLAGEETLRRLGADLHRATRVDHPHVVRLLGIEATEGLVYAVWERVTGRPLDGILTEMRALGVPPADPHSTLLAPAPEETSSGAGPEDAHLRYIQIAARKIAGAAAGLAAAHASAVVHGDLRPGRVLVDAAGRMRITGLGVALLARDPDPDPAREAAWYRSPECLRGDAPGPPADVFALGAILYELLTLRPAFPSRPGDRSLRQLASRPPPRPREFFPQIPRRLEAVISRCMDPDAARRPEAAIVARELRAPLEGDGAIRAVRPAARRARAAEGPVRPAPAERSGPGPSGRRWILVAVAAAVGIAVILGLVIGLGWLGRSPARQACLTSLAEGAAWLWGDPEGLFEPREEVLSPRGRLLSLGAWALSRESVDAAIHAFREATNLSPAVAEAWLLLGIAREAKPHETPEIDIERARELDPGCGPALVRLGHARARAFPAASSWLDALDALRAGDPGRAKGAADGAIAAGLSPPILALGARLVAFRASVLLGDEASAAVALAEALEQVRALAGEGSRAVRLVILLGGVLRGEAPPAGLLAPEEEADPEIASHAARLWLALGRLDPAARAARRAATLDPRGRGPLLEALVSARRVLADGDAGSASQAHRTAAAERRRTWEGALISAIASGIAGAPGDAARSLDRAGRSAPDPLLRKVFRAEAERIRGNAAAYARLLDSDPPPFVALLAAGAVEATGSPGAPRSAAQAARGYGRAARAFPRSAWIARRWAAALRRAGATDQALRAYGEALGRMTPAAADRVLSELSPWLRDAVPAARAIGFLCERLHARRSPPAFDLLLEIGEHAGRLAAIEAFIEGEMQRPENTGIAELPLQLGRVLERQGEVDRARATYRKATRLEPRNPRIREALEHLRAGGAPPAGR